MNPNEYQKLCMRTANFMDGGKLIVNGAMGLCGEIAEQRMRTEDGNASYRMYLIDAMYNMDGNVLEKGARYEMY